MMLSDVCQSVCQSVAYVGPKSRTETKIGTEVAHVTRDSDTTFKVKRSRSQGRPIVAASHTACYIPVHGSRNLKTRRGGITMPDLHITFCTFAV